MIDFINEAPRFMVAFCFFIGGASIGCLMTHYRFYLIDKSKADKV